uniref:Replication protein E1 n=1 Tax=Bat papillomavirus TaxID=2004707 RepID=A0A2Z2JJ76_9PAPI|nr:E1 [Bat papillomavirus]
MADSNQQGTEMDPEEGSSGWLLVEAVCSDAENDEWEDVFNATESDVDFVDDASAVMQGNHQALFHKKELESTMLEVQQLKRKFVESPQQGTPTADSLSPRLQGLTIEHARGNARKKLFEDSGIQSESSVPPEISAGSPFQGSGSPFQGSRTVPASASETSALEETGARGSTSDDTVRSLLASSNRTSCFYALFKEIFCVSFTDLTRQFLSDKTCCDDWVGALCGVHPIHYESAKEKLNDICTYVFITRETTQNKSIVLLLVALKHQKNRQCLSKYLIDLFRVHESAIFLQPPKNRSTPTALYFVQRSRSSLVTTYGTVPNWIAKLTMLDHNQPAEKQFCLTEMVQWCLDNEYTEESEIAFQYALLAEENENAEAFLKSNSQLKFLKDCAQMCRHYMKAQMDKMNMSEWIYYRCSKYDPPEDAWKVIVRFLKYQEIEFFKFAGIMQRLLKKIPKKCTLVIAGPPDTGKSTFVMTLNKFMGGKVISFVNSQSHFWLTPLSEAKIGVIDDATENFWSYADIFLRNGLDGNPCCIDRKHRSSLQMDFPPLLITTNVNVFEDEKWLYLRSRLTVLNFENKFRLDGAGKPLYDITEQSWASLFTRFGRHLGLSEPEDDGVGESRPTLKLLRGGNTEAS